MADRSHVMQRRPLIVPLCSLHSCDDSCHAVHSATDKKHECSKVGSVFLDLSEVFWTFWEEQIFEFEFSASATALANGFNWKIKKCLINT